MPSSLPSLSNSFLLANFRRIHNLIEYPQLLGTFGKHLDREFVRELLFLKNSLGLQFKTILDVGAAVGSFSRAARYVYNNAMIYLFEPIPTSTDILRKLASKDSRLKVIQAALGEENTEADFHLNEFSFSSSLLMMNERHKEMYPHTKKETVVRVKCRRLDSIEEMVIQHPAMLKLDVQGSELQVLHGAGRLLERFEVVKLELNFEDFYEGQARSTQIVDEMSTAGFGRFQQLSVEYSPVGARRPVFGDIVFMR